MGNYRCPNCKEVFYDRHIEVEDEYNGWAHCDAHDEENTCPECGEQLEEL